MMESIIRYIKPFYALTSKKAYNDNNKIKAYLYSANFIRVSRHNVSWMYLSGNLPKICNCFYISHVVMPMQI